MRITTGCIGAALVVAMAGCRNNEYVPAADTNAVAPAQEIDVSVPGAPDSTTGVSTAVPRGTISGDTSGRQREDVSPSPILRDTGRPRAP